MKFDKTVEIQRLVADEETEEGLPDTESYTTHIASLQCHIQPLEEGFSTGLEGDYNKDFLMFCRVNDIIKEDRVIDGDDIYVVDSVEKYEFIGKSHMELTIRQIQ